MRKREMFLVVDVETANMTEDALVYDIGYAVCDRTGKIYESKSMVIRDIFELEEEMMKTAYYAKKIPLYMQMLADGHSQLVDFKLARYIIREVMKKYNIKTVFAYNANFDKSALDRTLRYLTKSKDRWFLPYGTKVNCIWHMACQVIFTQKKFLKKAYENGWFSEKGNLQTSAEIAYRYMIDDEDFEEEHTGLADVAIEVDILAKCFAQHKKMNRNINRMCWRIPTTFHKKNSGL